MLPIGGLKEKLLAAIRAGIKTVVIPVKNKKDVSELPNIVKKNLEIYYADNLSDVLKIALTKPLTPNKRGESAGKKPAGSKQVAAH